MKNSAIDNETKELIDYLKLYKNAPKTLLFKRFAKKHDKAQGTIRNLYYKIAKESRENKEFRDKYLDGKIIETERFKYFEKQEEKELVEKIDALVKDGMSVRRAVNEISNGDMKTALRLQNKYRNLKKEKEKENKKESDYAKSVIGEERLKKLQKDVNDLVERISLNLRRENGLLKSRLAELEIENARLKSMFSGDLGAKTIGYFKEKNDKALN